jgi:hypothetical protein
MCVYEHNDYQPSPSCDALDVAVGWVRFWNSRTGTSCLRARKQRRLRLTRYSISLSSSASTFDRGRAGYSRSVAGLQHRARLALTLFISSSPATPNNGVQAFLFSKLAQSVFIACDLPHQETRSSTS